MICEINATNELQHKQQISQIQARCAPLQSMTEQTLDFISGIPLQRKQQIRDTNNLGKSSKPAMQIENGSMTKQTLGFLIESVFELQGKQQISQNQNRGFTSQIKTNKHLFF